MGDGPSGQMLTLTEKRADNSSSHLYMIMQYCHWHIFKAHTPVALVPQSRMQQGFHIPCVFVVLDHPLLASLLEYRHAVTLFDGATYVCVVVAQKNVYTVGMDHLLPLGRGAGGKNGPESDELQMACLMGLMSGLAAAPEVQRISPFHVAELKNAVAGAVVQSGTISDKPLSDAGLDGTGEIIQVREIPGHSCCIFACSSYFRSSIHPSA